MGSGKVAVPYYGSLYRPKVGYERIYFIVEDGRATEKDLNVRLCVWDNKRKSTLPEWLKDNGVENLVCREEPGSNLKKTMDGAGIHILNGTDKHASSLMNSLLV
jgi:predicted Fe-Mo cluster-binding NifX family protein